MKMLYFLVFVSKGTQLFINYWTSFLIDVLYKKMYELKFKSCLKKNILLKSVKLNLQFRYGKEPSLLIMYKQFHLNMHSNILSFKTKRKPNQDTSKRALIKTVFSSWNDFKSNWSLIVLVFGSSFSLDSVVHQNAIITYLQILCSNSA